MFFWKTPIMMMLIAGLLTACGERQNDRALSGAGVGAAIGAVGGTIVGGDPVTGAAIGAGAGAATGATTDKDDIDMGDPIWK